MNPEDEIAEYLLLTQLEKIENLKPDGKFEISLENDDFLNKMLDETRENFRNVVKQGVIKAYILCNYDEEEFTEISKTTHEYRKINLMIHIPNTVSLQEINAEEHERKIITFECQVFSAGKEITQTTKLLLKCSKCGEEYIFEVSEAVGRKCSECKRKLFVEGNAKTETIKNIFLKDLSDNSVDVDRTLIARTHGEQVNKIKFNDRVRITGIFKSIPFKKTEGIILNKIIIDVINIENIEKEKTNLPSLEKIEYYKKLANEGKLRDLLVRSFAYYIKGNEDQKLGILMALVGGVKTKEKRGRIHILNIGPPGTAKTATARFIELVSHKGCLTDITGASELGLFFGKIDTPDGGQGLSAGPLVKYSGGHVFIDEFEKGNKKIYEMLLKSMEEGKVSRSITGFGEITAPADTTIIACSNPKFGIWNNELTILENLGLDGWIVSRFDIIIMLPDIPNEKKDYELAEFILDDSNEERPKDVLSENDLNEFLNYARTLKPVLTKEAIHKLSLFHSTRGKYIKDGAIPIDNRQVTVLKRYAEALAKLDFSEVVTEKYADLAVEYFEKTLASLGMTLEEAGKIGESGWIRDTKKMKKEETLIVIYHEMEKNAVDGIVYKDEIITTMAKSNKWKSKEDALKYIENWHKNGKIIEKSNGSIKLV